MEILANGIVIMWVIYIVVGLVIYHNIFNVIYFDFGAAIIKEVGGGIIFATIMTWISAFCWWLAAIILLLLGVWLSRKANSKGVLILFVVLAIVASSIGIGYKNHQTKKVNTESETVESTG